MLQKRNWPLLTVYALATIQFAWCYLWLTRPYVNTLMYEQGTERMPFQGRCLMMLPMRLAHNSTILQALDQPFALSRFWFPKPVQPEVLMQAVINVVCLLLAGYFTTQIYKASSRRQLLTPLVYPLLLVAAGATYMMHTVQNFRFIYDLPSLAFYSGAMYLLYFRKHWGWFVALFLIATINRETTLLLLPLLAIDRAQVNGRIEWRRILQPSTVTVIVPLALFWIAWEIFIRHHFAHNRSEFYPRLNWNIKSILVPHAWPQMLSACGFLLPFVIVMRRRISNKRLQAWLLLIPFWVVFMFSYGILIETRVFGELIPLVVCTTAIILEEVLLARMQALAPAAVKRRTHRHRARLTPAA